MLFSDGLFFSALSNTVEYSYLSTWSALLSTCSTQALPKRRLLSLKKQNRKTQPAKQCQQSKWTSIDRRNILKLNSQGLSLDMMQAPLPEQLLQMEQDPVPALVNMATNTGLWRLPETDRLYLEDFNNNRLMDEIPEH